MSDAVQNQTHERSSQIEWVLTAVTHKGKVIEVLKLSLGRVLTSGEYEKVKLAKASNPNKYLRFGDIASDGRIFLRINPTGLDGEQWTDSAGLEALRASRQDYGNQNKSKIREKSKAYYQRNKARLLDSMKRWQNDQKEHLLEYRREYYAKTRERRLEKYRQGAEYFRQASKRNRRGKSDRQAAYSSSHRARKITSDLGLSRHRIWRRVYRMFFDIAAKLTKENGTLHTVDHIWPIVARRGQPIGLHVPWNLRVAEAQANMSKHNRPPTRSEIEEGETQWVEVLGLFANRYPEDFKKTIQPQICHTSEVLFHLTANTDPQRDSIFTKGPADVLDHATSEIAIGSKLGIDATKKLPGEGFKRPWPPLIKMDEAVRRKIDALFQSC